MQRDDSGRQVPERREIAAAQRQVGEGLRGDDVPGHAALRFEQQTLRHDVDHLADLPDLQDDVQSRQLSDAKRHRPALGPEARERRLDDVVSRDQIADLERAIGSADDCLDDPGRDPRHGDLRSRDDGRTRIGDRPQDSGVNRLRAHGGRAER